MRLAAESRRCPLLVSLVAVVCTLLVTMSVLFWNYSGARAAHILSDVRLTIVFRDEIKETD